MSWMVANHDAFDPEYDALPEAVQDELLAMMQLLATYGPQLGRPHADTLVGSRHANMKELRFKAVDGVWRVAFALDPTRQAIVLVAGETRPGWRRSGSIRGGLRPPTSGSITI